HLCFQARDRAMVDAIHAAGLAHGRPDNGAPGLRYYHPGYYAAFLLDPDGNNIEAKVDERVTARSAPVIDIDS
ncbi:MAG: VOC family protein, partial [Pseudomonadota bacterium]|nr:VOC family protein [Pseudomonadota bacterium]